MPHVLRRGKTAWVLTDAPVFRESLTLDLDAIFLSVSLVSLFLLFASLRFDSLLLPPSRCQSTLNVIALKLLFRPF